MLKKDEARCLYLDLMKRVLTNWIYGDDERKLIKFPPTINQNIVARALSLGAQIAVPQPFDPLKREAGRDCPPDAHTMIGLKRLDNLQFCIQQVIANQVPGDLIETGGWRGGAAIFMRAVLKAYEVNDRSVWLADSFEGLPPLTPTSIPRTLTVLYTYSRCSPFRWNGSKQTSKGTDC